MVELSVVTTVYKSEKFLPDFLENLLSSIKKTNISGYEIIFVIDGITDNSMNYLNGIKGKIPQIKIVELSRNFGHHYAAYAGLEHSTGKLVFLIDCDLEIKPEILIPFKDEMDRDPDLDVVYGFQKKRKGGFIEKTFGSLFWKLFNLLSDIKIPENIVTERLMRKDYVNALIRMGDKNLFLAGMMYWIGYKQKGIELNKEQRAGKSSYSIFARINLLFEAITSFSEKPLKLIFRFGFFMLLVALAASLFLITKKVLYPDSVLIGFTSIVVLILLLTGLLLMSLGVVGIYLARVFKQSQNRPLYIVKSVR